MKIEISDVSFDAIKKQISAETWPEDDKSLELHYKDASPDPLQYALELISTIPAITTLDLSYCPLNETTIPILIFFLSFNLNVSNLTFFSNEYKQTTLTKVSAAFCSDTIITSLKFSQRIGKVGVVGIGYALEFNSTLTELDLSNNEIINTDIKSFCSSLLMNSTLQVLHLQQNKISDDGAKYLGKAISANTSLQYLDLQNNQIYSDGFVEIINGLSKNDSLTSLNLTGNPLSRYANAVRNSQKNITPINSLNCHRLSDCRLLQVKYLLDKNQKFQKKQVGLYSQIGILTAFYRANPDSQIKNSILPLIFYIILPLMGYEKPQKKSKDYSSTHVSIFSKATPTNVTSQNQTATSPLICG